MKRSIFFTCFARCLRTSSFALVALVAITLALPSQLSASPVGVSGEECLDDSYLGNNTPACVSNDVRVSVVTVPDPIACDLEGPPILVNLNATLVSGSTDRYDVGIYLAEGNHDAKATGGLCYRDILYPITTVVGDLDLTGGAGPFRDTDDDFCGDIKQVDGQNILFIENFLYTCRDGNNDGQADIGACLAWDNNSNTVCSDVLDAIPSTGSKCRCELLPLGNVFIAGKILVDKVTIPAGSAQSFEFQTNYGANFFLTDAAAANDSGPLTPTANGGGTYSVAELGPPAGWQATSVSCVGDEGAEDPSAIDISSGETVTCTFTNTEVCPSSHSCDDFECGSTACDPEGALNNCDIENYDSPTTICRESAGLCDAAESCTGTSLDCPADGFASPTTECRASAGDCDVAESCTGTSADCPTDGFVTATTECRASSGVCDVEESCTGTSAECPSDGFASPTTECRASGGVCDVEESCTGTSADCPVDAFEPATTICNEAENACDEPESCTGTSVDCPFAEPTFCPTGEGCSPGFWRTHTELWDGAGDDDVTSFITTSTSWNDDLSIPSCDGKNLNAASIDTLGETIRPTSPSTNTLFHFTACLIGADSVDGFGWDNFSSGIDTLNELIDAMEAACEAGGTALAELREACVAANFHDNETVFCPFDDTPAPF